MKFKYSQLPRANPEKDLYFACNEQVDEYSYIVGRIGNLDHSFCIEIWVSDYLMSQSKFRTMLFDVADKNYLFDSRIVMTSEFANKINENEFLHALIWHEVGHFHTVPYLHDDVYSRDSEARKKAVLQGEVLPEEQLADLFSAYICGKEITIKALKHQREERRCLYPNDGYTELAIKEFNNRIHFLKSIEDSKMLEKYYEVFENNRVR